MTIGIEHVERSLEQRGTEVLLPRTPDQWRAIENKFSIRVGVDFKRFYARIDGFINYDHKSQIRLWSIEEIIENDQVMEHGLKNPGWLVIGDFLVESDLIVASVTEKVAIVKFQEEDRVLSHGLCGFLLDICNGKFDFMD